MGVDMQEHDMIEFSNGKCYINRIWMIKPS